MDGETLDGPNRSCRSYGRPVRTGLLVKKGATRGQKQALGRAGGRSGARTSGPAQFERDAEPPMFETAIRALAAGNSRRGTARIVQIDQDPVCAWVQRAAHHGRLVLRQRWRNLPVAACPWAELWRFGQTQAPNRCTANLWCDRYGAAGVWIACAPVGRLVVAFVGGKRTHARANRLLERLAHVPDGSIPFCTRDQRAASRTALLHGYGAWSPPARHGRRGRSPQRRRGAPADGLEAQGVTPRARGKGVAGSPTAVCGAAAALQTRRAARPTRGTSTTSFGERENLTLRQPSRRLTRKTSCFRTEWPWLEQHLWLVWASDQLVLPHARRHPPLAPPAPPRGSGSARRWRPMTPALAAGMTDPIWTTAEWLSSRVPAGFRDQLHAGEHLFPPLEQGHQGN